MHYHKAESYRSNKPKGYKNERWAEYYASLTLEIAPIKIWVLHLTAGSFFLS